ncbi:MAG: 50S ribosomal protein L18 [Bacteroidia bacterium]|nr:50S ribosomal protein L18 [Bacteroidia bacterium]
MATAKDFRRSGIRKRVRKVVSGDSNAPRMSVFRSNKQISAQLIDDVKGITIAFASSSEKDLEAKTKKLPKIEQAKLVGKTLAEKAIKAGIKEVRFDRNGYLYHGRVKSLADGAREGGLKF